MRWREVRDANSIEEATAMRVAAFATLCTDLDPMFEKLPSNHRAAARCRGFFRLNPKVASLRST
ncbi:MAG: hypothetical protein EAZ21_12855 [Betaproteobacteria bacterium]|nr:MAG: hypothetical protein EAZ21_12855 [Betaproteobacteria bacterium]